MGRFTNNHSSSENEIDALISDVTSNHSTIGHSGNSDVDVNVQVHVDTMAIAYAILCAMLGTNRMTNSEFESAVQKLEELTNRHKDRVMQSQNDVSKVTLFDQYKARRRS
ncbi:hypothetical protein [Bacillus sp. T33-2]|uniref:hypothetical protein n=1 Tax=Bacillus sp. T33-2 TaxID=2054168 RepID=UPI000C7944C3|nr:hypothetical protein [Bacillus sp. T33-2]PLR96794.1 hypothetical protein CVD19_10515 [Bacillus sp. T33-2]